MSGLLAKARELFGGGAARGWIAGVVGRAGVARIAGLCALQALMSANAVAFALLMRQAIDSAVAGEAEDFRLWLGLFAASLMTQVAMIAGRRALLARTQTLFENQLRARAFGSVLAEPCARYERQHSGELMTRMTSDVTVVAEGACTLVPTGAAMAVRLVGVVGAMFALVPGLTMVFVAGGCVAGAASVTVRPLLKRLHKSMQEAEGGMRSFMQECLDSLLVVHAFGCERKVAAQAADAMGTHRRARLRKMDVSNGCATALTLAVQLGYILGFGWCAAGILAGTCTYGTLMAVVQLIGQIQSPFANLGGMFSKHSAMLASAERLMALGESVDPQDAKGGVPVPAPATAPTPAPAPAPVPAFDASRFADLRLSNVTFAYDCGDDVLCGCDFSLRAGEFVGVTGPSGAGKSTLTRVLLGAYQPQQGAAFARDASGAQVPLWRVRGLFAYVPQGNRLMAGTVRDVVAFADQGRPDDARVEAACRAACAWDFVSKLPQGLDTVLGQRGAGLSEGQMQRLSVARAVYSGAPVLLLDEATSALDAATEQAMLENLRALPGRAAVLVTHRAATLAACDRVVRVADGVCRECGSI